jgi:hypothetical protein
LQPRSSVLLLLLVQPKPLLLPLLLRWLLLLPLLRPLHPLVLLPLPLALLIRS